MIRAKIRIKTPLRRLCIPGGRLWPPRRWTGCKNLFATGASTQLHDEAAELLNYTQGAVLNRVRGGMERSGCSPLLTVRIMANSTSSPKMSKKKKKKKCLWVRVSEWALVWVKIIDGDNGKQVNLLWRNKTVDSDQQYINILKETRITENL